MTSRIASFFAPDPLECYARCEDRFDLIVTRCNHLFCRNCLKTWFLTKQTCPLDQNTLPPITDKNIREKDEDPMINESVGEGMQYTPFKLLLERFSYSIQKDLTDLQKRLAAERVTTISNCKALKEKNDSPKSGNDECSCCLTTIPRMYFILHDKDPARVGRFLHAKCLQPSIDDESLILDISAPDMVKVAVQLPPKIVPKKPFKPSPVTVFIVAIILPVSLWALAMNTRIYHNKSFVLFLLSIPALIIFKLGSLLLKGLKAIFTSKPAY